MPRRSKIQVVAKLRKSKILWMLRYIKTHAKIHKWLFGEWQKCLLNADIHTVRDNDKSRNCIRTEGRREKYWHYQIFHFVILYGLPHPIAKEVYYIRMIIILLTRVMNLSIIDLYIKYKYKSTKQAPVLFKDYVWSLTILSKSSPPLISSRMMYIFVLLAKTW